MPVDEKQFGKGYQPPPLPADAPLERVLYRSTTEILPTLRAHNDTLRDTLGFTQADVETFSRSHAEALQEAGLPGSVFGPDLIAADVQARVAQRRGAEPDTARLLQDEEDLRREYRVMLGSPERAERLWKEVGSFLTSHPKLHRLVQAPGFGEAPAALGFMRNLAEHVRTTKHI